MAKSTVKSKTRKAVANRFKITGTGKILRRKQGKRHLLRVKNSKRKRGLRKVALASPANAPSIRENMPFS